MPHFDDIVPYVKKRAKDVADQIEENRKRRIEHNRASGVGTLKGLEEMIMRRKREAHNAK